MNSAYVMVYKSKVHELFNEMSNEVCAFIKSVTWGITCTVLPRYSPLRSRCNKFQYIWPVVILSLLRAVGEIWHVFATPPSTVQQSFCHISPSVWLKSILRINDLCDPVEPPLTNTASYLAKPLTVYMSRFRIAELCVATLSRAESTYVHAHY